MARMLQSYCNFSVIYIDGGSLERRTGFLDAVLVVLYFEIHSNTCAAAPVSIII